MPDAPYIYLHDINGNPIKPVTDLSAINMTTTNGIHIEPVNGGTIGIRDGYIQSSYYLSMVNGQAGPARQAETYIDGGTIYKILGGYTVSQEAPGPNASPYVVPSEVAVREAIDAYVATGGSNIVPGKAINVTGGSINASVASVLETLTTTAPSDDRVVTPNSLQGALSVGQAVDVTCPFNRFENAIVPSGYDSIAAYVNSNYLATSFSLSSTSSWLSFGWSSFQKFASGLKYLLVVDITNNSQSAFQLTLLRATWLINGSSTEPARSISLSSGGTYRLAIIFTGSAPYLGTVGGSNLSAASFTFTNCRQYEVTALTDEAIAYLATLENPDDFFRSTDAYTIRNKYLVKQDMVSPFIPIISMTNKDLTIGAGLAYKMTLTDGQTHRFTVDTIPANGYGWDSHLQLFIAGASHVEFVPPLALMNALTPNAGHNITIKWRAGQALAYVEDTDIGYVVSIQSGTTNGTLAYGLTTNVGEYIVFAGSLDGQVIEATGTATCTRAVHLVGNGVGQTILQGIIDTTYNSAYSYMQNLTLNGATVGGPFQLNNVVFSSEDSAMVAARLPQFIDVTIDEGVTVGVAGATSGGIQAGRKLTLNGTLKGLCSVNAGIRTIEGSGTGVMDSDGVTRSVFISNGEATNNNYIIKNVKITGGYSSNSGGGVWLAGTLGTVLIENCLFTDNYSVYASRDMYVDNVEVEIIGSTFSDIQPIMVNNACRYFRMQDCSLPAGGIGTSQNVATQHITDYHFAGNMIMPYGFSFYRATGSMVLESGCVIDIGNQDSGGWSDAYSVSGVSYISTRRYIYCQDNVTFKSGDSTATIDGCRVEIIYRNPIRVRSVSAPITICGSTVDTWSATNIGFWGIIDAHEADTVRLDNTTMLNESKLLSCNRLQLPAGSTNSFVDNTTAANTKIFDAGLIVIGDDPANPSGSAYIVTATGTTTYSGIGTYIDKEGDSDFEPISNVATVVNGNTSGNGSLGAALTGSQRFIKIASGVTGAVGAATTVSNKNIITHDYEPIIGGTFSLTGCTIDEATKTLAVSDTGSISIPNNGSIAGSKGSIIDLSGSTTTRLGGSGANITLRDLTVVGGNVLYGSSLYSSNSNTAYAINCIFSNSIQNCPVTCVSATSVLDLTNCIFKDNPVYSDILINGVGHFRNCEFHKTGDYRIAIANNGESYFYGTNKFMDNATIERTNSYSATSKIYLTDNSTIDLCGNTAGVNPIQAPDGIIFGSSVSIIYDNGGTATAKSSVVSGGIYKGIKNDGTIILGRYTIGSGDDATWRCSTGDNITWQEGRYIEAGANGTGSIAIIGGTLNISGATVAPIIDGWSGAGHVYVSGACTFGNRIQNHNQGQNTILHIAGGAVITYGGATSIFANMGTTAGGYIEVGAGGFKLNGVTVAAGTYSNIYRNGTTSPYTPA